MPRLTFVIWCGALCCISAIASATPVVDLSLSAPGFTTMTVDGTTTAPPSFTGSFAGYNLSVGTVGNSTLLSYAIQISSSPNSPPNLTFTLSETGLTTAVPGPGSTVNLTSYNTAILHTASTVLFQTYYDVTDTVFGESDLISSGSVTGPNNSYSNGPINRVETAASPYSVTKVVTLEPVTGATPTIDGQVYITAPEPMSLVLLTTGIAGLGVGRRLTRRARLA